MTLRVKYPKRIQFTYRLRSSRIFIIRKTVSNCDPEGGRINSMKIILFHMFALISTDAERIKYTN